MFMKILGKKAEHIWDPYMRKDVLGLAFLYATYNEYMQKMTGFGMKGCLSQHFMEWKLFNDQRNVGKGDEKIYSSIDKNLRYFVRQCIKGGKNGAFNKVFESPIVQNVFKIIKDEFKFFTNKLADKIAYYMKYSGELRKWYEEQHAEMFDDYRQIPPWEMEKYVKKKLGELPFSKKLTVLKRHLMLKYFDANVLYAIAMPDDGSIYPKKKETRYVFTMGFE